MSARRFVAGSNVGAQELAKQNEALMAIVEATGCLLGEQDILKAFDKMVGLVGQKLGVDACFVYGKGFTLWKGESDMFLLASYDAPKRCPVYVDCNFFGFMSFGVHTEEVLRALKRGDMYESSEICGLEGECCLLLCPIFVDRELWGAFGISSSRKSYRVDPIQKSALEILAKNISSVTEKFFVTKQLGDMQAELLCINQNLEAAASKAIADKLEIEQEKLKREKELFEVKEKYHLLQQDDAYNKQITILKDDLSHKMHAGFLFESFYKPLDILSGDVYGLVKISEESAFVYIIDAMGKGLSASVTAVVSAAYINDAADNMAKMSTFCFRTIVESYQSFIKKQINDEEMVCAVFVHLDGKRGEMEVANFSMPELLFTLGSDIVSIKANNYPITRYFNGVNIEKIALDGVDSLLIYSDGLKDVKIDDGFYYKDFIRDDFAKSDTKNMFLKKMFSKVINPEDDVSMVFISRYDPHVASRMEFEVAPTIEGMVECVDVNLKKILSNFFDGKTLMQLECALNELLMNAIEHGVLGISYGQKHALLEAYEYDEYIESEILRILDVENKKILVSLEEILLKGRKAIIIKVKDCGAGFDVGSTLKALSLDKNMRFNGRGIIMSDNIADALFYNESGNEVSIIKFL